jgi:hypothetical protein
MCNFGEIYFGNSINLKLYLCYGQLQYWKPNIQYAENHLKKTVQNLVNNVSCHAHYCLHNHRAIKLVFTKIYEYIRTHMA